jgi:hypothetical protein
MTFCSYSLSKAQPVTLCSVVSPHLVQGGEVVQNVRDVGMIWAVGLLEDFGGTAVKILSTPIVFGLSIARIGEVIQQAGKILVIGAQLLFDECGGSAKALFRLVIFASCLVQTSALMDLSSRIHAYPGRCSSTTRLRSPRLDDMPPTFAVVLTFIAYLLRLGRPFALVG